jgi:hypothetical protein
MHNVTYSFSPLNRVQRSDFLAGQLDQQWLQLWAVALRQSLLETDNALVTNVLCQTSALTCAQSFRTIPISLYLFYLKIYVPLLNLFILYTLCHPPRACPLPAAWP